MKNNISNPNDKNINKEKYESLLNKIQSSQFLNMFTNNMIYKNYTINF